MKWKIFPMFLGINIKRGKNKNNENKKKTEDYCCSNNAVMKRVACVRNGTCLTYL